METIKKRYCPECGGRMVIQRDHKTQDEGLFCAHWPKCSYREPLPEDVILRRMGAEMLPLEEV